MYLGAPESHCSPNCSIPIQTLRDCFETFSLPWSLIRCVSFCLWDELFHLTLSTKAGSTDMIEESKRHHHPFGPSCPLTIAKMLFVFSALVAP